MIRLGLWSVWAVALAVTWHGWWGADAAPSLAWLNATAACATSLPAAAWLRLAVEPCRALLAAAATWLVLGGLGLPVLRWTGLARHDGPAARWLAAALLGLVPGSLLVLGLADAGLARRGLLAAVMLLAAASSAVAPARRRGEWTAWLRGARRWEGAVAAAALGFAALAARLPLAHGDAHVWHFAVGEEVLRRGRWALNVWNDAWQTPLAAEMLYLPGYGIGGIAGAKAVNLFLFSAVLAAGGALAGAVRPGAGWPAAALLAGCGAAADVQVLGKHDLAATLGIAGAAWCLVSAAGGGARLAAALCAGFAVESKYTAAVPAAALLAALVWLAPPRRRGAAFLAAAGAAVPLLPWWTQNALLLGNPVQPFAARWLGGLHWSAALEQGIWRVEEMLIGEKQWSGSAVFGDALGFAHPLFGSFLLGALLPRALAARRGTPAARALLVVFLASFAVFASVVPMRRYLLPILPLAAALAAPRARAGGRAARGGAAAAAAACLVAAWVPAAARSTPAAWPTYLGGRLAREDLRVLADPAGTELRAWVNARLARTDRLIMQSEQRRLGLVPGVIDALNVSETPLWWAAHASVSAARMRVAFRQLGATHLVHNPARAWFAAREWFTGLPWTPRALATYRELFARHAVLEFTPRVRDPEGGGFTAWRLTRRPHAPAATPAVLPGTEGALIAAERLE